LQRRVANRLETGVNIQNSLIVRTGLGRSTPAICQFEELYRELAEKRLIVAQSGASVINCW